MNRLEAIVYQAVKGNPALKQFIRNTYQSLFDLLPRPKDRYEGQMDCREGYFFGFHDVSPFSGDDTKLLANHSEFDLRMPRNGERLDVGYFDFSDGKMGEYHKIGESTAWNWHKGCRLQWIDDNKVIFNNISDGKPGADIVDVTTGEKRHLDSFIDSVYIGGDEQLATSFSYQRLERCMPGYGYQIEDSGRLDQAHPADTGLFLVNLETGDRELVLSLDRLASTLPEELRGEDYLHFVTHTEFSLDGRYISFLYRRIPVDGNYMKRWTQIRVYDRRKKSVITLPTQTSGSHYVWNRKGQLVASCNMNGRNCHVLYDMSDIDSYRIICGEAINSDGHQSFISDTEFITDTYPDKRRVVTLYKVDTQNNSCRVLAKVYSPKKFQTKDFKCHIACDLHPRVSKSGKYVCFDSASQGVRSLRVMKL